MPFSYHIDTEQGLGIITVSGRTTGSMLIEAAAALASDEAWSPAFDRLWDCSGITWLDVTPEEQMQLVEMLKSSKGRAGRAALVVHRDLDRMIGMVLRGFLRKDHPVEVFQSMAAALAWLGKALPGTK